MSGQLANYVRFYTDDSGESHFEDLDIALAPVDFAPPAGPLNVAQFLPATQSLGVGFPAGWAGETPHPSPRLGSIRGAARGPRSFPYACPRWDLAQESRSETVRLKTSASALESTESTQKYPCLRN